METTKWVLLAWASVLVSCIDFCNGSFQCRTTQRGVDYSGSLNESRSGKSCLKWRDVLSGLDPVYLEEFAFHVAEADVDSADNFCRNPTIDTDDPWCFTEDNCHEVATEKCNVPFCAPHQVHCKNTTLGKEYSGNLNFTKAGRVCQRWDSQSPHNHTRNDPHDFPDASLYDAANFCRNPDDAHHGPWCYTVNPEVRWEYCDVPYCYDVSRIASVVPKEHKIPTDTLTDGDFESCHRIFSPSAKDFKFSIDMTSTWEQLNVEFAFNSDAVKSCKDSLFFAFYAENQMSCTSQCQSLRMCHWVEVSSDMAKAFCRFTCGCKLDSCQSVTLTVPSQLPDFELCEVKAWSG